MQSNPSTSAFRLAGLHGEVAGALSGAGTDSADFQAEVLRLLDPQAATKSLHWGRNYLYRAEWTLGEPSMLGPMALVVKQFRCDRLKDRWRQSRRGSKARLSWRMAHALTQAGVPTPEPLLVAETEASRGPSFYVCRHLEGVVEARYVLRAAATGRAELEFPLIDLPAVLHRLGAIARRLHDAGIIHRDLSVGNVLLEQSANHQAPRLWIIDLNRARQNRRVGLYARMRDLCRLSLFRAEDRKRLLAGYFDGPPAASAARLYDTLHHLFQLRNRAKAPLAPLRQRVAATLAPRRAHAHIPGVPRDASRRDKVVWDHLSDQPHQHASRTEKLTIRLTDAGAHLEEARVLTGALPRIWRRYRTLQRDRQERLRTHASLPWDGLGLALRPEPTDPEGLLAALDELGARRLLLRLHPWQTDHHAEEELSRELVARGYELAFALPQNRELVRDPGRWRAAVDELGERFSPFGHHFQIGQAINRSKWGIWRLQEYVDLYAAAAESLRRYPGVELLGPAVIDFEHHVAAAVLNLNRPDLRFDIVSALLYVDRRGAPESRQAGFDTVGKAGLLKAIAETSKNGSGRCWITEFNWPLWEGPHSPAGKKVSVDEEAQADYTVRYFLLTLTTGWIERVYFWQLAARGYGLLAPSEDGRLAGARRRPAFAAVATLRREVEGAEFVGTLPTPPGAHLFRFVRPDGGETAVGWSVARPGDPPVTLDLPAVPTSACDRSGQGQVLTGTRIGLTSSPTYFRFDPAS